MLKGKTLAELTEMLASMKRLHNTTDVDTAQRAIRAIEIQYYYQEHPEQEQATRPNPVENAVIVGIDIRASNGGQEFHNGCVSVWRMRTW